jgi:hypothetical protein
MIDNWTPLKSPQKLDDWLMAQEQAHFPPFGTQTGQKSYPERYVNFADALQPIHNIVEKGAMVAGALEWMKTTRDIAKNSNDDERANLLEKLEESDPIVHLNNHGKGHVDKVIQKVSEILHFFERGHVSPYEGFFLLCAIQLHDTGNIFGRNNHESKCQQILDEKGKPFIPDSFERNVIKKLALVHGGTFTEDRDTIGRLTPKKRLFDRHIRKTLLAALLRFGDELADDHSRADIEGLNQGTVIDGGIIYHRYSEALHTVQFERNSEDEGVELCLCYEFDSAVASQTFSKRGRQTYLLDEIYDRTLKTERERRYCMRYLRPCFSLDRIKVEIVIQNSDALKSNQTDKFRYTLEEKGYPNDPAAGNIKAFGSEIRTGEEELNYMKEQWRVVP